MKKKTTPAPWTWAFGDRRVANLRLRMLRIRAEVLAQRGDFFPAQVRVAAQYVERIITGCRSGVVIRPFQSGKTGVIGAISVLIRDIFGQDVACVLVIANDQLDLRAQNVNRLEHLNVEVLTLSERRNWQGHGKRPLFVIYDEAHYGDGKDMTIDQYFTKHGIKENPNILFCGVSATPYASQNTLEFDLWPDMKELEKKEKYNSPAVMLRNGRIRESRPLFTGKKDTLQVLKNNEVYKHIVEVMRRPLPSGYGMIRCSADQAALLKSKLREEFGQKIFIKDWNMKSPIVLSDFFAQPRYGKFTLILVQHKARMGTTIDTRDFEFFFEYTERAKLDTIAQSFMGRASGYGKRDHKAIVYTKKNMAAAYTMFIESKGSNAAITEFVQFCEENGIDLARRADMRFQANDLEVLRFDYHGKTSIDAVIKPKMLRLIAAKKLERKDGIIRRLSKQEWVLGKAGRKALHPDLDSSLKCGPNPGDWSLMFFDDYAPCTRLKKDWVGIRVVLVIRKDLQDLQGSIGPSDNSIFGDAWAAGQAAS